MGHLAHRRIGTQIVAIIVVLVAPMVAMAAYAFVTIRQSQIQDVRDQLEIQTDAVSSRLQYVVTSATDVADFLRSAQISEDECQGVLERLRATYSRYNVLAMGNADGDVVCSSPLQTPMPNVADRDWFQAVIGGSDMAIGNFQMSRTTAEPNIIVASPVRLAPSSPLSVVGVGIRLSWLSEFIASLGLPEGAVFGVIDESERFLVRYPDHDSWVGSSVGDTSVRELLESGTDADFTITPRDGVRRHYVGAWTPINGTRYFVYTGLPVANFTDLAARVTFIQIALILLAGLLLAAAAVRLARIHVVDPLEDAKAFAGAVAGGSFNERLSPTTATRELQELTDSLNAMAGTLERNARDMAKASELARLGVWRIARDGGAMVWSDQVYEIFGVDASTFAPTLEAAAEHVHPEDGARFLRVLRDAAIARTPYELEFRVLRGEDVRYCRAEGDGEVSHDGDGAWLLGMCQDVTTMRRLQRERDENAERFQFVALATADAIWDWDLEADTFWWSHGMEVLFGHPVAELEPDATSWTNRIHPEDRHRVMESIHEVIEGTGVTWESTYRFLRRDDSYAIVHDRGFMIRDQAGRGVRMVGGMSDITERTQLEERLRQSQRLESIGQLTGGVAHDFNNLLTVMMGNAEVLTAQLEEAAPTLAPTAEMIAAAAQRGATLTQQLLAFARQQPLEPTSVDANGLIESMIALVRRTLGEHIEIELLHPPDLWPALVDPTQLESALLNLCLNARDAMPSGGRLTIETDNVDLDEDYTDARFEIEPGQYVRIAVSDTGVGIPPQDLDRVFEPFFTTKRDGGTGLGLSMVYGFVKQSNGHIAVYSEPGQGTTVRMYLPRFADADVVQPERAAPDSFEGEGERILVVEDDPLVRNYVEGRLLDLGYEVRAVETANAALALLHERDDFDLLFTDVVIPGGMNGKELADEATRLRPGLRVLFTSGYTENAIVHHGRLDPGVQLLSKPYRPSDLARKIREALTTP